MKGNPMQRNFGVGASSPAQKSAYPAKGDPKKGDMNKLLSMLDDYGSGSESDQAAQKTADKAKYDYQTETGFKGDLPAGEKMSKLDSEAKYYKYLNESGEGDVDMKDVNTRRLETRNKSTSGDKERTNSYAKQAALKKSALKHAGHGEFNHGKHGSQFDKDASVRHANKNDPRSQRPNAKKLDRKTTKAAERRLDADAKMAKYDKLAFAQVNSGNLSGKEKRTMSKAGNKAGKAAKKANVAESVRRYQAGKVNDYMDKPKKKKTGGGLERRGRNKTKDGIAVPNKTRKIFGDTQLKKDQGSGRKKESKEDKTTRKKDLKTYRQNKGLRGAINARRTGKGKDKI